MTAATLGERILTATGPKTAEALERLAPDLIASFEEVVPDALCGRPRAIHSYIVTWRSLERRVLEAVHEARPLLLQADEHEAVSPDLGRAGPFPWKPVLDQLALHAPFSVWVRAYGPGLGTAMTFVSELRAHLPGRRPLAPPLTEPEPPELECDAAAVWRFARLALLELEGGRPPLERVSDLFDLSITDLARLFGVSRQAMSQWLEEGVPPGRTPKLTAVSRLVDLLARKLKPDRIPGIVRRPAEAYGGLSMLEMIKRDRQEELLELVEDAFDWAKTA